MAISEKGYSELVKKDVFTAKGMFCGKISDIDLDMEKFRIKALVIDTEKGSFLSSIVGDRRGVIVPFQMVQAIGDVVIIKHVTPSAMDDEISDIDICLITNIKKEFLLEKYENKLNRKVSLHEYNDNFWNKAKKLNTNLINSICNGIVLSGELEIL